MIRIFNKNKKDIKNYKVIKINKDLSKLLANIIDKQMQKIEEFYKNMSISEVGENGGIKNNEEYKNLNELLEIINNNK